MKKKVDIKQKADKILKENPKQNKVVITEDGQPFFSDISAKNHHNRKGFKKAPETFFRNGHTPKADEDQTEALEKAQKRIESLEGVLSQVAEAADTEKETPEVKQKTPAEVVAVVQLRESLEKLKEVHNATLEELKAVNEQNEQLVKQLDVEADEEKKTNDKKAK